ncbi:MAG: RidA family protein [Stellaceae bacterium]
MAKRRSIHIVGFKHGNPIPAATRMGPLIVSSVIVGRDPATAEMPDSVDQQCVNIFAHIRAMLAEAGATTDDVVKIDFWVPDPATGRGVINQEWIKMFPDFDSCPARHTHTGGGKTVQAAFMAYIDS